MENSATTEFERFVKARGIPEELWPQSKELRAWTRRHYRARYVPEPLLHAFHLNPESALLDGRYA
jgi:hypothetical protein